ncbi:ABC transporter permease [Anaerolentibacter hominis]|uniref:ABC transporter permease n=1 Tax=Anaerolentibacter hominis TaxID=3079009 RepID=UPI0031B85ECC
MSLSQGQRNYVKNWLLKEKRVRIWQVAIFIGFLALWELTTYIGLVDPFIFSSPSRLVKCFIQMAGDGSIFYHTGITVMEVLVSFLLVLVISIAVAVCLWWKDGLAAILDPYLVILNSLPKSALAPVFIVWLGANMKTIIIAAISVSVFGSIITLYKDFRSVEEEKIKLIYTLGGKKKDVLWKVILPANIPSIISLMKVNIGLSLVGVIIGEFLAAKAGLGYLIIYGSQVFKLDYVLLSIVILCILATLMYKLLEKCSKLL